MLGRRRLLRRCGCGFQPEEKIWDKPQRRWNRCALFTAKTEKQNLVVFEFNSAFNRFYPTLMIGECIFDFHYSDPKS